MSPPEVGLQRRAHVLQLGLRAICSAVPMVGRERHKGVLFPHGSLFRQRVADRKKLPGDNEV